MHFFLANRLTCFVLLFALTIASSMSQEICVKLRDQQEKIRAIGEANDGTTLVIITTSGHIFELDQNSSISRSNGDYHLNISQEPSRHVSKEWSDVNLNLSENTNLLYALYYTKNFFSVNLRAMFKIRPNWNDCLNSAECRPGLQLGYAAQLFNVINFNNCIDAIEYTDDGLAFLVSHKCHNLTEPNCQIMFWKPKHSENFCYNLKHFCFKPKNGGTVLAASYLTKPYSILLFIYSSGLVEIREVDTFPNNKNRAPEPVGPMTINDFIHCGAPKDATVLPTNMQNYWIIMITVILLVIVALSVYIYKIEIMSDSPREKKRKKKKKRKHSPSTVNTKTSKGGIPSRSASSSTFENSPKGSSTGVKFLTAQGSFLKESSSASDTSARANRSNHAKSSELTFATAQGSSVKGSTVTGTSLAQGSSSRGSSALGKPSFSFELGSTTNSASLTPNSSPTNVQGKGLSSRSGTSTAKRSCPTKSPEPALATAQNSNPKGSSTELGFATAMGSSSSPKEPSTTPPKTSPQPKKGVSPKKSSLNSNDGTTLSSAFGTTTTTPTRPQNVNSKDSSKRTLVQKKQTMFRWLVSLFREKKKKMEKRNNQSKPKDTKKDSEEK